MKVLVATTETPFVPGGATLFVEWLVNELRRRSHEVDVLNLPYDDHYESSLHQIMALRLLDVSGHGDRLIAIRTPSHLLKHPNKIVWFIHHYRGAYDLWGTEYQSLPNTPEGIGYRNAIVSADNAGLRECRRVYCNSVVVRDRLAKFNGIDAQVLYPPLYAPERFVGGPPGDYILYFSRLTRHKRQWLAIESLRHTNTAVKLVIAGQPDPGAAMYLEELRGLIAKYRLEDRVSLLPRWVSEQEKIELYSKCLAVAYFPFDEDSYGYPLLEGVAAGKALLTTIDAGGTLELVIDQHNGLVRPPDPELIGQAMDFLFENRQTAADMGRLAGERSNELQISWDHVVSELLA